jgi:hypothetical protein
LKRLWGGPSIELLPRLLATILVVFASCSATKDVYVANPCSDPLEIRLYVVAPEAHESAAPIFDGQLPALSLKFFEDLGDSNTITVEGNSSPIELDPDVLRHDTFVIPATFCP